MRSIRTRLLTGLLISVVCLLIVLWVLIYARIEDEVDDLFDAELQRSALGANLTAVQPLIPLPTRKVQNPQEGMVVSIWQSQGVAPDYQSRPLPGVSRSTRTGFSKQLLEGREWRLFATRDGARVVVVAQPKDVRDRAARQITQRTLLPTLGVLPLAAVMIWIAVYVGLWPLARITEGLRLRSHRDLSPIKLASPPPDISPLVNALNELMVRLSGVINAQKTFIADAAHELLTPLTALRLQAQMLARARSPARQQEAMAELQGGIDRTLQLAHQLLTLARHDGDAGGRDHEAVDISALAGRLLSLHAPLAAQKALRTELLCVSDLKIMGDDESISILGSNLIDNAIKYADYGGAIRVSVRRESSQISLQVEDSGPGIPPDERERVFDRFYRRRDTLASGNGLGLAIAKDIARQHGASITLQTSDALGGLNATVSFPVHP